MQTDRCRDKNLAPVFCMQILPRLSVPAVFSFPGQQHKKTVRGISLTAVYRNGIIIIKIFYLTVGKDFYEI